MLKLPVIYSQRDPRWADKLLGFNTSSPYTIGNYGCLITSLSMLVNQTPDQVNETIKANNGFIQGGMFVWSKVSCVGLTQEYVSYSWSGPVTDAGLSKAKEYIAQGKPLLAEVDFNPATDGEEMHFVLIVGFTDQDDAIIADPWTGTIRSMNDVYGGFKRGVCQFRVYDKLFPQESTAIMVPVESKVFENLVRKSSTYDKVCEILNVQDNETVVTTEVKKLVGFEDIIVQKDNQITLDKDKITQLEAKLSDLTTKHEEMKADNAKLLEQVNAQQETIKTEMETASSLQAEIELIKKEFDKKILTGWKKIIVDFVYSL